MQGLDMYYNNLQAQHQRRLDERAELEANMDKFKELISKLLEENHPACVDYEVEWFFNQTLDEQKEVYRHLQLHGFEGFKNVSDDNLFESCVHNGTFLMEE